MFHYIKLSCKDIMYHIFAFHYILIYNRLIDYIGKIDNIANDIIIWQRLNYLDNTRKIKKDL